MEEVKLGLWNWKAVRARCTLTREQRPYWQTVQCIAIFYSKLGKHCSNEHETISIPYISQNTVLGYWFKLLREFAAANAQTNPAKLKLWNCINAILKLKLKFMFLMKIKSYWHWKQKYFKHVCKLNLKLYSNLLPKQNKLCFTFVLTEIISSSTQNRNYKKENTVSVNVVAFIFFF